MQKIKTTVLFFLFWMASFQCVFSSEIPPKLALVQREGGFYLLFSWNRPVSYSEKKQKNHYTVSFSSTASAPAQGLKQIITALPEQWHRMTLKQTGKHLEFSIDLPENAEVDATKKNNDVFISLQEKKENRGKKEKTEHKKKAEERQGVDSVAEAKPVDQKKRKTDISVIPYPPEKTEIDLNVSVPTVLKKTKSDSKISPSDSSGYRAASLSFPWQYKVSVAAFRRDGYLWLVFDHKGEFDFSVEKELYKDIIHEIVQIPHPYATIYRLITEKGYNPALRREGLLWVVDLMYQPMRSYHPLNLILQRKTPFGPRIFVPMQQSVRILEITDPEIGDLMYVAPVFSVGNGMASEYLFVDVSFLQTAQGLVIIPNVEDLKVLTTSAGIEIRGPEGGMRFSSEDILEVLEKATQNTDPLRQVFNIDAWRFKGCDYWQKLKELQNNVLQAEEKNKDVQRLVLARYYFANGMYPETLGILRTISIDNPSFEKLPGIPALRGAANFMMKRYDDALKDFNSPALRSDPEVSYWRFATLASLSKRPEQYLEQMKEGLSFIQSYPYPIKTHLALVGLKAAVGGADDFAVQNFMASADNSENSASEKDEIVFYQALWLESLGRDAEAREKMGKLAQGKNLYFRAFAGLEKLRMDLRAKTITPQERIKELERLSYAWRGGAYEYNLMMLLASAYQDQGNFSEMLYLLKDMQNRFQGKKEREKIQELMENVFQQIYLTKENESLSPITTIALYEEFKDLMPSGEKGSRIVRRLADQLVSMDLLTQAADLLEDQLKKPLNDREKGIVSTRLALVRLLNKEPDKVLGVMEETRKYHFSDQLKKLRAYIQAKALSELDKPEQAAALIANDHSLEAKKLRAEIYWRARMWDKAADALKELVNIPKKDTVLNAREAQNVLDWATALRLAGKSKIVIRLRENFMPYMKKTKLAEPFDFITKTSPLGLMDYRSVENEVQDVESFQTFLKKHSDKTRKKALP